LALETGGVVVFNRNDVKKEVEQSMARGATYYSILYHPADTSSYGHFHKIEVRTNTQGRPSTRATAITLRPDAPHHDSSSRALLNPTTSHRAVCLASIVHLITLHGAAG